MTHAAVTENKRLGAVLAHLQEQQDKASPKKKRAGTRRTRYEPTPPRALARNGGAMIDRTAPARGSL